MDPGYPRGRLGHSGGRLGQGLFALLILGQIEKEARLLEPGAVFLPGLQDLFQAGLLFQDGLGLLAVVPEIGAGSDLVQLFELFPLAVEVKDAS